ncbi:MAG: pyridoxal-phosphate dependent enzyme [Acidimicrobiia bacterium]|nr:pyridoxal-phosphate dependent enzyme [Acidimicrobiia bacterium]
MELPARTPLALLPTPLVFCERLSEAWGGPRIWMKRDDLTGFELSGNKVRKLEFHFAAAAAAGADTVITCGALQSNHSRATAFAAARLGFRSILLLRRNPGEQLRLIGNYLLHHLGGAEVRLITPEEWEQRDLLMAEVAAAEAANGHPAWVIPEGASDALGMWGFVLATRELADQIAQIPGDLPVVWHAASSGGTTAGIGWGFDRLAVDIPIVACSIGDPAGTIREKVDAIWSEAGAATGAKQPEISIEYIDNHVGGGYGRVTTEELTIQTEASSLTGTILDPTYTGKAIVGLRREISSGRFSRGDNVVFWHTGGGFAALAHDFTGIVAAAPPAAGSD